MISGKNKELYYTSSVDKQLNIEVVGTRIVIDNSMREQDTFTLAEALNDGSELKFGSCLPNQISFIAHDMPAGLVGKTLRPVETLEGNEDDPFTYGKYKIFSAVPTADRTKRQITAYDAMYDILNADVKAWYAGLSFPMALKQFRYSFFAYLGVEQEETTLVNDSMTVNKTLIASSSEDSSVTAEATISGKTIIEAICEINGAFGNMNRAGKFEYVILPSITSALYPADDLYPRDDLFPSDANTESMTGHYFTFDYEDFQSKAITQLEIRADDNTAGAIVGNPGNTYVISGNFLVSDKTGAELEQIANNVLPIMAQAAYTPIKSCTTVGNPCLELGDPIRFNTSREIVETYLLQRTLTGVQSKRDSISAQGTQTHSAKVNSIRDTIESVERRTGKLERNADHLQSTYEDLEEQTSSKFEQTASSFEMSVTGGDKTVGIVIKLLNSDGDVISESSENANITITGVVRFEDLANAGSTTINGENITTGYISADRISGGTLRSETYLLLGHMPEYSGIENDYDWSHYYFAFSRLYESSDEPVLFVSAPSIICGIDIRYDDSVDGRRKISLGGCYYVDPHISQECMGLTTVNTDYIDVQSVLMSGVNFSTRIYGTHIETPYINQTSDRNMKTDIKPIELKFDSFIDGLMELVSTYYLIGSENSGHKIGFIAQDVEDLIRTCGLTHDDIGIVSKIPIKDEFGNTTGHTYSLGYNDFIGLLFRKCKNQDEQINSLKQKNLALQNRLSILEKKMEVLYNVINNQNN